MEFSWAAVIGTEPWMRTPGAVRLAQAETLSGALLSFPQSTEVTGPVLALTTPRCKVADVIAVAGKVETVIVYARESPVRFNRNLPSARALEVFGGTWLAPISIASHSVTGQASSPQGPK